MVQIKRKIIAATLAVVAGFGVVALAGPTASAKMAPMPCWRAPAGYEC